MDIRWMQTERGFRKGTGHPEQETTGDKSREGSLEISGSSLLFPERYRKHLDISPRFAIP